jgi:hypothetical protein
LTSFDQLESLPFIHSELTKLQVTHSFVKMQAKNFVIFFESEQLKLKDPILDLYIWFSYKNNFGYCANIYPRKAASDSKLITGKTRLSLWATVKQV